MGSTFVAAAFGAGALVLARGARIGAVRDRLTHQAPDAGARRGGHPTRVALRWLSIAHWRHRRSVAAAIPELLEAVARELRSGGTVGLALDRLAVRGGAAGEEARQIVDRAALGLALHEAAGAWARLPRRRGAEAAEVAGVALGLAVSYGGRAAGALDGLAEALRARTAIAAEARALSAQGRLSAAVVGALPVVTLAGSSVLGGGGVATLVATDLGRAALVIGLGLQALAVVWMRRIVRVEL